MVKFVRKTKTARSRRMAAHKKYAPKKRTTTFNRTRLNTGLGFPKTLTMTHRYVENIVLTSTSGALGSYNFTCNGLYRPNISVPAGSPMYFDQVAQLYNHYHVIGSKIRVRGSTNSSTYSQIIGIMINDDTNTSVTNISGIAENSLATTRFIGSGTDPKPTLLSRNWSAKKFFPGSVLGNDELLGTATSNPSEQSYYSLYLQDPSATVTVAMSLQVEITYIAVWSELRDLAQS